MQCSFSKNGPLGTAWLAAHLERRLCRSQINEASVTVTVDAILFPEVAFSLRISAYLLLGIVRVYSRKVDSLLSDCNGALSRMRKCFPTSLKNSEVPTLPAAMGANEALDVLDIDDLEPPPDDFCCNDSVDHHVASAEQITLQEHPKDNDLLQFELYERFPDGSNVHVVLDFEINRESRREPITVECPPPKPLNFYVDAEADSFEPQTPPSTACRWLPRDVGQSSRTRRSLELEKIPETEILERSSEDSAKTNESEREPHETTPQKKLAKEARGVETRSARKRLIIDDTPNISASPRTPEPRTRQCRSTVKKRKRLVFDATPVLSNNVLRQQLLDADSLVRPRKRLEFNCSSSLFTPSVTGICDQLQHIYEPFTNVPRKHLLRSGTTAKVSTNENDKDGEQHGAENQASPNKSKRQLEPKDQVERGIRDHIHGSEHEKRAVPEHEPGGPDNLENDFEQNAEPPDDPKEAELNDYGESMSAGCDPADETTNGWSPRTRALGLFIRGALRKQPTILLEQVLARKTRREAACTFFEMLVLTSMDYVQVKQEAPFNPICIASRSKLMESPPTVNFRQLLTATGT